MLKPDLYLEVIDLFAISAVDSAFSQVTGKSLLYIKHLDGRRSIVGSLSPNGVTAAGDVIIDISATGDTDLRSDYFNLSLTTYDSATFDQQQAVYDSSNQQILLGSAPLTASAEYFMNGNLYAVDLVEISKNLRDK